MESPTEFTVDAKSVPPVGAGKVRAILTDPTGQKFESPVTNNNDGTYKVAYTAFAQGPHTMDVTYNDAPIPQSPFKVTAVPGCDPSRVKAYGPGLRGGFTNQNAEFTVDMKGAGKGGLGLAIEGPVEAQMNCKDNRDGTCHVEYKPVKAGDYSINVKYADQDIPGSPFLVRIQNPVDANKVKCYGPGLNPQGVIAGEPASFVVDASESGPAPLDVTTTDAKGIKRPADVMPIGDNKYQATYMPVEEGPCKVDVKYANQAVPQR
ncbi:hypothetical protein SNE40_014207 [Patella caerulea]|uniref:Uncharacterized protein n=1 Tax=Patella caerulea TaxID=87958 RepID=A0AAN8JHX8_PATCE